MGTTINDLIDRRGGVRAAEDVEKTLESARRVFADVSAFLELEIDRLFEIEHDEIDDDRIKRVTALIRENQRALLTVLDIEAKLGRDTSAARAQMLDLEDARAEIESRLARLAA